MDQTSSVEELELYVELVDAKGRSIGTMEKIAAHAHPGTLHRAFSLFLLATDGRTLLQRRASTKYHSPGVWSNTCCGHPQPGVDPADAAAIRVFEELGVHALDIQAAGIVKYRHEDPSTGLVEHEYNHTLVGVVDGEPNANPEEVDDWFYADAAAIERLRLHGRLSVWFHDVYRTARSTLERRSGTTW